MNDIAILFTATICTCVGLLIGKWLESLRWRSNAAVPWRVASGGRLYKVRDVTPWDPSSPSPGEEAMDADVS